MNWWRQIPFIVRNLNRRRADQELDEEIRSHLEMETQLRIEDGLSPDEAHYAAMRTFGGEALIKERSRNMWGLRIFDYLLQDLRYSLRVLGKNPSFTLVVILTLALGIGANTVIFSVIDAVLLRPLPYSQPDRLAEISLESPEKFLLPSWGLAPFQDWQSQKQLFEEVEAYSTASFDFVGGSEPERLTAGVVSPNLFPMLGVHPQVGRSFVVDDSDPGNSRVAIISDELWRQYFGAGTDVVGKSITLNEKQYRVPRCYAGRIFFPSKKL